MRTLLLVLSCGVLLGAGVATAETYTVRPDGTGDYPTIQTAIDAAVDGDIIELTDGIFIGEGNRDIDYLGKAITIRSQAGNPAVCVIDCEGTEIEPHRGFSFIAGEQAGSVLTGITVQNGWVPILEGGGGAIRCDNSSAPSISACVFRANRERAIICDNGCTLAITDCVFEQNEGLSGGGICSSSSTLVLSGCSFTGNTAPYGGGAIACGFSSVQIADCEFTENSANQAGAIAFANGTDFNINDCLFARNSASEINGAISVFLACTGLIERCTFNSNEASAGGAALGAEKVISIHLRECTFWGQEAAGYYGAAICLGEVAVDCLCENTVIAFSTAGRGLEAIDSADVELLCCDIYGNAGGDWVGSIAGQYGINGNICENPLFCDPGNGDFTVACTSPCAPFTLPNPECDLIGAWPVGCGGTPVTESTWGGIKAMFRR